MEYVLRLTQSQHIAILNALFHDHALYVLAACGCRATDDRLCLSIQDHHPITQVPFNLNDTMPKSAPGNAHLLLLARHDVALDATTAPLPENQPNLNRLFYATVQPTGEIRLHSAQAFSPTQYLTSVVGHDLQFLSPDDFQPLPEFTKRHEQLFGRKTASLLRRITAAVIGCSGTGSPLIEQLARLGISRVLMLDPKPVEFRNLNRITNATFHDAKTKRPKVEVLADAIRGMNSGTDPIPIQAHLSHPDVIRQVAASDVLFGCLDSVEGRHVLNRLATFYSIPYFDIGVGIRADGNGGIRQASGSVHYIQPGGSSLLSRGCYTLDELHAESLRRTDPAAFADQLRSGYILGAQEDTPAVISINMQLAALAVNEFLARIHPYRTDDNCLFAIHRIDFKHGFTSAESEPAPCPILLPHVGRGDVDPLLDMPSLSEGDLSQ